VNLLLPSDMILPAVKVPLSLVAQPARFGGDREQDCLCGDLVIRDGHVLRLERARSRQDGGGIVLPRLTECHVHLDKCHTIARMEGVGGDLQSAIAAQARDRETWTREDIVARASRGMDELARAGCGVVRSHVDWSHGSEATSPPLAWHVLSELTQQSRWQIDLQIAPLTGVDDLAHGAMARSMARIIAEKGRVLGAYVFDQPNLRAGIQGALRVADQFGLALDFHVDEGLQDGLHGLEIIADMAIATGFEGPILCGHACSLMNLNGDALKRAIDKIVRAGLTVASLPASNLYLQGRTAGTPDRRGVTRIAELRAAGVPVVIGTDNVRDAFCPLGRHDPRESLALAALAAHLDPPFGDYLPMITTSAKSALGLAPTYVDGAAIGDLLLFDATSSADMLAGTTRPRGLSEALKGEIA